MRLPAVGPQGQQSQGGGPRPGLEGATPLTEGTDLAERAELTLEVEKLRERISRLSEASVRTSASLDLGIVLREVADSARALTGAYCSAIVTTAEDGTPQHFVTSGLTEELHRQLEAWPNGPRLFDHLRTLPGALRIADLPAYLGSLGFYSDLSPSRSFLGRPMRHRGFDVGSLFLVNSGGVSPFTPDDEELLVLFASQAATAIVNARTAP